MKLPEFSDFIVYVDESGHAAPEPDPNFPCFVLAFCLFRKDEYSRRIAPNLQNLKFSFFGHDMVVLHERAIRRTIEDFAILREPRLREEFHEHLNSLIEKAEFAIIHKVIGKDGSHLPEDNLYHLAAQSCLEGLFEKLQELQQADRITHVVFEKRGKNEDGLLELEFRRVCAGANRHQVSFPFVPVFASKQANSTGLQFADLIARPIGLAYLRPQQKNRAYEMLRKKDIRLLQPLTQSELDIP